MLNINGQNDTLSIDRPKPAHLDNSSPPNSTSTSYLPTSTPPQSSQPPPVKIHVPDAQLILMSMSPKFGHVGGGGEGFVVDTQAYFDL